MYASFCYTPIFDKGTIKAALRTQHLFITLVSSKAFCVTVKESLPDYRRHLRACTQSKGAVRQALHPRIRDCHSLLLTFAQLIVLRVLAGHLIRREVSTLNCPLALDIRAD